MSVEQLAVSLIPILISTGLILLRIGREQQRMNAIEKHLEEIHRDVLKKDIFDVEIKSVSGRIEQAENRLDRVERRVFNGSGHPDR